MLLSDLKACLSSGFRCEVFITFLKLGTPDYAVLFPFRCFLASNQVTTQSSAFSDESYILFQYTYFWGQAVQQCTFGLLLNTLYVEIYSLTWLC